MCYSTAQKLFVVNRPPGGRGMKRDGQPPFTTGTAWLVFKLANTSCYKPVGDHIWYFYGKCETREIYKRSQSSNIPRLPLETDCALYNMARRYDHYRYQVVPLLPGYRHVFAPWASFLMSWQAAHANSTNCSLDRDGRFPNPLPSIGNITLNPAPGEFFSLKFWALDEMLNKRQATLSISVETENNTVLLSRSNFMLKISSTETFTSTESIRDLMLHGRPGDTGCLVVQVMGGLTLQEAYGSTIELRIPFRLRGCHLGFVMPSATSDETKRLIDQFDSMSDDDKMHDHVRLLHRKLSCMCGNDRAVKGGPNMCISHCKYGKHAFIKSSCWAGQIHRKTSDLFAAAADFYKAPSQPYAARPWFNISKADFVGKYDHDPLGKFQNNSFAATACSSGTCSAHNGSAVWLVGRDNPCTNPSRAAGPMCTQCLQGFRHSMASWVCVDCKGREVPLAGYLSVLFVAGLLLFIVLVVLNIGVLPVFDSGLLFAQVYYSIHGSDSVVITHYAYGITLGFGALCARENLPRMAQQAFVMIGAVLAFAFLGVFYCLGSRLVPFKVLQKLQHRHTIRHALWMIVLCASTVLAYITFLFLRPIRLGGRKVLRIDASVDFLEGDHRYYAFLAITIFVVFVLPTPILLIWKPTHRWPVLTGFIDEATRMYEPSCQWWASFNIIRRIAFAVVMALVVDGLQQRIAMVGLTTFMLGMHGYHRPFSRQATLWKIKDFDNIYELLLLFLLCGMAVYRIVWVDVLHAGSHIGLAPPRAVLGIVTIVGCVIYLYQFVSSWRDAIQRRPRNENAEQWSGCDYPGCNGPTTCSHLNHCHDDPTVQESRRQGKDGRPHEMSWRLNKKEVHTGLRDPLLVDFLMDG